MDFTRIRSYIPASFSRTDTATYTLDDVRKEVDEICKWLDFIWPEQKCMPAVNFKIMWNEKPHPRAVGRCTRKGEYSYILIFSHRYFEVALPKGVHECILHEVLHATKNGMTHKAAWKAKANFVSNFLDFRVTRLIEEEYAPAWYNMGDSAKLGGMKYKIYCPHCNNWCRYRTRASKVVTHPENFICGGCKAVGLAVEKL